MLRAKPRAGAVRLLSLLTSGFLLSCASQQPPIPHPAMAGAPGPLQLAFERAHTQSTQFEPCDPAADHGPVTLIAIERTSCYGLCSMYTLIFHADGAVEYQGVANVPEVGSRRGKLSSEQFRYLARLASEIGYFDLQDNYSCAVTDSPTVYTKVEEQGRSKIIRHYAPNLNGPARLRAFEEAIDSVEGWVEWKK